MRPRSGTIVSVTILVLLLVASCMGEETSTPCWTLPPMPTIPSWPTNTPAPTVVESGLAYGIPCKPPCWQGLTPDISTRQESAQVMEHLRASGQASDINEGSTWFIVYPLPSSGRGAVFGHFEDNILQRISGSVEFYYPVGTLVEQFGGPEGIDLGSSATVCSSCEEWEPPTTPVMSVPVRLLYPNQGLWFLMLVPLSGLGCICPEMKVTSFRYYAPTSMQEALAEFDEVTEEDLVEWHGFGGGY